MNTSPPSNSYPSHPSQAINPALLAFQNQSQHHQHQLSQNQILSQPGSAKFPYGNATFGAGVAPAQLINGLGNVGMGSLAGSTQQHSMNPAQLLQHQQQILGMGTTGLGSLSGLSGMNGMALGGMGINPAALSANIASGASGAPTHAMSGMGMNFARGLAMGSNAVPAAHATPNTNLTSLPHSNQLQHTPQSQQTSSLQQSSHNQLAGPNQAANFNLTSFSREQLAHLSQQLSPQERHMIQARMMAAQHQQLQQIMQGHPSQQQQQQQISQAQHGLGQGIMGSGNALPSAEAINPLSGLPTQLLLSNQQSHNLSLQQGVGGFYERERSASSSSSHNQSHPQGQVQNPGHQAVQTPAGNTVTLQGHQSQNQHHPAPQAMPANAQMARMPPPPRPSTAQSQGGPSHTSSRPSTAQSHRPPSREFSREFSVGLGGSGSMNGFVGKPPTPLTPQLPQQMQMSTQNMYPAQGQHVNAISPVQAPVGAQIPVAFPGQQQGQPQSGFPGHGRSSTPVPGSPYRGAKRKAGGMESPRLGNVGMGITMNMGMGGLAGVAGMGGGMNMVGHPGGTGPGSIMGPPVLPRQLSNPPDQAQVQQINGYPAQQHQQQQAPQAQQQHPLSAGLISHPTPGMLGMGGVGIPNLNTPSVGSDMVMGMGVSPSGAGMVGHQRQTSLGPQTPVMPFPGLPTHAPQQHSQLPMQMHHQQQTQQPPVQQHGHVMGPKMGMGLPKAPGGSDFRAAISRMSSVQAPLPPGVAPSVAPASDTMVNGSASAPTAPPAPPGLTLPSGVTLNRAVSRVTTVPLSEAAEAIPPLTPESIKSVQEWMRADRAYDAQWRQMRQRMAEEMQELRGKRYAWWERDPEGMNMMARRGRRELFDVRYPRTHLRDGRDRRRTGRREGLRLPRRLKTEEANRPEQLVPIRLEFDVEHHKMRDTFIWNLNDPVVTPENFAQSIVDDYGLTSAYHPVITKSIQDQLSDFKLHCADYDGDSEDLVIEDRLENGKLDVNDVAWWATWRKGIRTDAGYVRTKGKALSKARKRRKVGKGEALVLSKKPNGTAEQARPVAAEKSEGDEQAQPEEMRILIKLDIIVGSMKLDDQLEWDLDNEDASPEQFSEVYAKELGLGGEFKTAIAHCIREQVQMYQKSLFLVGRPIDGSPIPDEDLRASFLPVLTSGARPISEVQSFTPLLNYLSDGELERNEKERDKDLNKRRKRNMRSRRGLALPDREPIRTYRTPAIGFPELDPATQALAAAVNAPTSRRAAAAAASLTIANMVASENGTPFMPQPMQIIPHPVPVPSKEKKPKGLFKPPSYPPYVLRPRARLTAPTPSTAVDSSSVPTQDSDAPPATSQPAAPPPDSKAAKALTAKRAKELEREAKEKEYADGQHANMIDGVWHCSNCGCPESIAIGRRKGPLGDKSQCGPCGKYWHRHRRPLPVEYSSDPEYHLNLKRDAELAKTVAKKKGGAAALRAQNAAAAAQAETPPEIPTPRRGKGDVWVEVPSRSPMPPATPAQDDERAISPISTTSSASEPPLAQRVKGVNGVNHTPPAPNSSSTQAQTETQDSTVPGPESSAMQATLLMPAASALPEWLTLAMQEMQEKYPDDKFEVISRKSTSINPQEWRIKCLDCPGKLYTPGPAETLSNYEVHIKNRLHRQRVSNRVLRTNYAGGEMS